MMGASSVALGPSRQGNVSERTYQMLRAQIVDGTLTPGEQLTERRIATLIGVSRTPLRAALSRLEGEQLVERLPTGAVVIRRFSVEDVLELLTVRRALEGEAAALATGRVTRADLEAARCEAEAFRDGSATDFERFWEHDDNLHALVAKSCGETLLATMIAELRSRARTCHVPSMPPYFIRQGEEHCRLLEALAGTDAELARAAMRSHLQAVRSRLVSWLANGRST